MSGGGGGDFFYISYIKRYGRDQCNMDWTLKYIMAIKKEVLAPVM